MITKKCSTCGEEKLLKYFSFRADTKKYRGQCRKCHKGYENLYGDFRYKRLELFKQGKKSCSKCGEIKSIDCFNLDNTTLVKLTSRCKSCLKEKTIQSTERRSIKTKATRYNISVDLVEELLKATECEICGNIFIDSKYKHIDHDHKTGDVRGVLCKSCNIGLGMFYDNNKLLLNAINYLNKNMKL